MIPAGDAIERRWSISAVRAYMACPRQWWLTRVANVDKEVSDASLRGQLMHAGLAAGYAEMARAYGERERWPADTVARRGEATLEYAIAKEADRLGVDYDGETVDTAARALRHLGPQPTDVLLGVERDLDIRIDGVPIIYRADVIYRRAGVLTVRDWKSRKTLPKARDLPRDWQLCLGALAAARTFGDTFVRVELASIGGAVAVAYPITVDEAREVGRLVAATAWDAEHANDDYVPLPGSACADCPVRKHCPVHAEAGTRIPTPGMEVSA